MRSTRSVSWVVLTLALGLAGAAQATGMQPMPAHDRYAEVPDATCEVSADWLKPGGPPEADFVKPFDGDPINCDFHRWAVQEYLYFIQPGSKEALRFLDLANPQALFCAPGGKPAVYPGDPAATCSKSQTGLLRLRSGPGAANAASRIVFMPRTLKGPNTTFDADRQAGSNAVLVDQKGQVVYYTSQVNQVFYDFVRDGHYYEKETLKKAAAETSFPVRTVEVKSAWRIASKGTETYIKDAKDRFLTIDAVICQDKACKSTVPATMAMVGLHIVGRVEGHPEMVWATFEHNDNVPICNKIAPEPNGYSFFPAGKTTCGKAPFWEDCNQIPKDDKTPSALCRAHPFGEPDASPGNFANMQSINNSLFSRLPATSVLRHYNYTASVWTEKQTGPPALINLEAANIRGGKKAANAALESFTQEKNCLHCHTHQPPQIGPPGQCFPRLEDVSARKNLYVSHLFGLLCTKQP